jgi:hypothetical protein
MDSAQAIPRFTVVSDPSRRMKLLLGRTNPAIELISCSIARDIGRLSLEQGTNPPRVSRGVLMTPRTIARPGPENHALEPETVLRPTRCLGRADPTR